MVTTSCRSVNLKSLGIFKRGDTFAFYAKMVDEAGNPLTLDAEYLKSQVRDANDRLYANLVVSKHPTEVGTYLFQSPSANTAVWPIGILYLDIQVDNSGVVSSTETFMVEIIKDITKDG